MRKTIGILFGLCLTIAMALSGFAATDLQVVDANKNNVQISKVHVNNDELTNERTYLELERGETFEVKVRIKSKIGTRQKVEDVEVNAFISGYEHSSSEKIFDSSRPFDLIYGQEVVKKLTLTMPERAEADNYWLRVIVSGKKGHAHTKQYGIRIQPSDSEVVVSDFEISPEDKIRAGGSIIGNVRIKNLGDSSEKDVKVTVKMPEISVYNVPSAHYIEELEEGESASSEFVLRTNACTRPGLYEVVADITYDGGDKKVTSKKAITITEGNCNQNQDRVPTNNRQAEVEGKTILAYSTETQRMVSGSESAYPITLTNTGTSRKSYMLAVEPVNWASMRVSPSNVMVVEGGSTKTAYVYATANERAEGNYGFTVSVKDSSGETLQTVAMRAEVAASGGGSAVSGDLTSTLTAGLVIVVALFVAVGLVVAFRKNKNNEDGESQTYY